MAGTTGVGGLFEYTNRAGDLATTPDWNPGEPWDLHYTGTGFEDRDQELESYLGSGITTRRFFLVNSAGTIVATFGPVSTGPALTLNHNDALTTDSSIAWTQPATFGAGTEEVIFSGPEKAGAAGVPPAVVMSVAGTTKTTTLQGANELDLATEDVSGNPAAEIDMTASTGTITVFTSLLDVLNLSGAAHAEIKASAFTVVSTEREKIDLEVMADDRLLDLVGAARAHRFRTRMRPQSPCNGGGPLGRLGVRERATEDHRCSPDTCGGTRAQPCPLILNDTFRIGLIAEHVHKVAPEITSLDAEHKPDSLAVDQVATTAFGAVGALLRKVEALEARIAVLEGGG